MSGQVVEGPHRFRDMASVIEKSLPAFNEAYRAGVMGVYGQSQNGRMVELRESQSRIVDFVRCSYLGLDNHPDIVAGAVDAIHRYHSLHWSCARTRLNFALLGELEERLSELFRARVVTFSTVLAANLGMLPLIASGYFTGGVKPLMVFDRLCHITLAYHKPVMADETEVTTVRHNDLNALEDICRRRYPVAYIADGVYSMGGHAPINDLRTLQERYGLYLYIDDAHGISICGRSGEGYARSQLSENLGPLTTIAASLGKGFGASGGFLMLGDAQQERLVRQYAPPYAFSAAPNLAAAGAAMASAELHGTQTLRLLQQRLGESVQLFDSLILTDQAESVLPIRFIRFGDETRAIRVSRWLLDRGYYTSATFFPTVAQGKAGVRVCLTAAHERADIEHLCNLLQRCLIETSILDKERSHG